MTETRDRTGREWTPRVGDMVRRRGKKKLSLVVEVGNPDGSILVEERNGISKYWPNEVTLVSPMAGSK